MQREHNDRKELLLYAVIWAILLVAPILSTYLHALNNASETTFPWDRLFEVWVQYLFFFVAFAIHNFLLAPLIVYRRRRALYITGFAALLAVFTAVQCVNRPDVRPQAPLPPIEQFEGPDFRPEPHDKPLHGIEPDKPQHGTEPDRPQHDRRPPVFIGQHDIVAVIIFLLMLGLNLGVKYYFRHRRDTERLAELKRENLQQQLEYLKYQINPHFLMNTLNNIHALVDIDPEQAKETIVELSKIMRFVLYEGSKQKVPLRQELIFLDNYIQLMRMRVTDHVDINVEMPQATPDREIPPLMLITFVENAFKHGVSYRQQSHIRISLNTEGQRLHFLCTNSKRKDLGQCQTKNNHGGMGLNNILQRLTLLYGSDYQLEMNDGPDTYDVHLCLPLS